MEYHRNMVRSYNKFKFNLVRPKSTVPKNTNGRKPQNNKSEIAQQPIVQSFSNLNLCYVTKPKYKSQYT